MPSMDELHQLRWNSIKSNIPYAPEAAIVQFWRNHPELGAPLGAETLLEDGSVAQVFLNAVVRWSSERGAELVP
jgi:hypothetical protein